jgi:hypothetical protein
MASTFFILKSGVAPPDLARYPAAVRGMFWSWVWLTSQRQVIKGSLVPQGLTE